MKMKVVPENLNLLKSPHLSSRRHVARIAWCCRACWLSSDVSLYLDPQLRVPPFLRCLRG
ncbi:hypothetical protein BDZ94DRAFT_1272938 [Collybia nuda]|uniref:Uncharacterized protein n=1 Tax=Collybia nuda TaxID=64659 RepID=A0A9P5XXK6_9AGAR|nr:hypothetical protein BDZ94DRAFT_1272938 [Collybia nuda]